MDAIAAFNALPAERLEADLLACCAVPAWAARIAAGRPYRSRNDLLAAAGAAARAWSWDDVRVGLAAHPRIGERARGGSREAAWSRREQAAALSRGEQGAALSRGEPPAAGGGDDATASKLALANRAYEQRFGHVFLIFASGRTPEQILAAARARLANDDATERAVVADELRRIALLRLERLLDE
jgi:2-oxo-4-hydroxy-4-carboxy-5-ureidoimidazoline decarboxylase